MECRHSKLKMIALLALTALMVTLSIFCTTHPSPVARVAGWVGAAFFGLGFFVIPVKLLRGGPVVIVDEVGIEDTRSPASGSFPGATSAP